MAFKMLELSCVISGYGLTETIRDISFSVEERNIVSIIGANGAGKTSLLRTISGLLPARKGKITFFGHDITNAFPENIVRIGISQVPEGRQIFNTLSVIDNLLLGAYTYHRRVRRIEIDKQLDWIYDLFPVLKERKHQKAGTLSGGEQQMLAIGRALMSRPKLLLLDEPSIGLAPLLVLEIFRIVRELRDTGTTILLVEQNAGAALKISDVGHVMETGRIVLSGKASELAEMEEIKKAYLGR